MKKLDYIQELNDLLLGVSLEATYYVNMIIDFSLLCVITVPLIFDNGRTTAYEFSKNGRTRGDYIGKSGFIAGMAPVNE